MSAGITTRVATMRPVGLAVGPALADGSSVGTRVAVPSGEAVGSSLGISRVGEVAGVTPACIGPA